MTLSRLLPLLIFLTSAACSGQIQKSVEEQAAQAPVAITGDTVAELGKDIGCMIQDRNGTYWFASNMQGAYRYDGKTLTQLTEKDGLCSNFVTEIQEDFNGNLWFSTHDGFCRFDGKTFTDYTDIITNARFGKLYYRHGGLFLSHKNGICFYDGQLFTNFVIHPDTYRPSDSDMNRPYSIYSMLVDKAGNIWFGTQDQGVCRYDGNTFSYLTDKNLAGPPVRAIHQDKQGIMWFGNNGAGLFRYDGTTLRNITEENGLGNPEFLKGQGIDKPGSMARIFALNEDNAGHLWIGTIDAGLWKYDGTHLTNYTTQDGLPGNSIWKIYKDRKGELWFICDGESVCKFNGSRFERFEFE